MIKHVFISILQFLFWALNCCITAALYAQTPTPNVFLEADQALAYFGYAVASAGDVNGDGFNDVIVGAYGYDNGQSNEGRIYIYHGSAAGLNNVPATVMESNQISAYYGGKVASAGDVNGDGYGDIIVAASSYDNGQFDEGRVFIYHGSAAGIIPTPVVTMESNQVTAKFGISVSGSGDLNNDGYDDVIVGAYWYDNPELDEGRVYVYLGSSTGINPVASQILEQNQATAEFGHRVSIAGDVNGDGYDDIIVGADKWTNVELDEGRVFIFHGNAAGVNTTPAAIIESNLENAYFGSSVSKAGDVNNDGYDDVIVGAEYYDNGQAFVYSGSPAGIVTIPSAILITEQSNSDFGISVSSAGDFNNDGYGDVLVGASDYNNGQFDEGRSFIYFGSVTGLNTVPARTFESDQNYAIQGYSVASAGDINNDGFDDIIIGSYLYDNDQTDEGRAYIYHGNNCTPSIYFPDNDSDTYGDALPVTTCTMPAGYVTNGLDCNDEDSLQNPATVWYVDVDNDQFYAGAGSPVIQCELPAIGYEFDITGGGDCDDLMYWVYPDAPEQPDGSDNDCNGLIDEGLEFDFGGLFIGDDTGDRLGNSIDNAGDINGDGYDDIIVGSFWAYDGLIHSGKAYVFFGNGTGLDSIPSQTLTGDQANAYFGNSVSGAGDVNGDGYNDVVIGQYLYNNGMPDAGRAYIYLGSPAGLILTPATILESDQAYSEFGSCVSKAGDVNNDGYDDVIVGSPEHINYGRVYVYHGSPTGISTTPSSFLERNEAYANFGLSIADAGDVNADGYDDIIVGAPDYDAGQTHEGKCFIYHGSPTGLHTNPSASLESNQDQAHLGSVAGAGDVNGDGYDDVIVGARSYDNGQTEEGRVYVLHGSPSGIINIPAIILEVDIANAWLGFGISSAGDVNNDGYDDIVAGGYKFDPYSGNGGKAYVFTGSSTGINPLYYARMETSASNADYGNVVSDIGDQNSDGFDDIMVGAPEFTHFVSEGAVYVYYSDPCNLELELCNAFDDNCNGLIDDGITESISISAGGATTFCQGGSTLLTASYSGTSVQWKKNGSNIPGATTSTYSVNKSGNYSAVTTSPCGSATSSIINVTVNKNPNAGISAGGATTFCAGGSVTLTEIPVAGCTYQWYKGASLIAGATSTNYVATTAGNYKCRVTKIATGCYKNSNAISVTVPCKEGEWSELIGELGFKIFPNPNSGTFEISAQNLAPASPFFEGGLRGMIFEIYNSLGELIYSQQINSTDNNFTQPISIENISSGIYFVRVGDGNNFSEQKLIIE